MKILSITAQKPHSTGSGTYLTELVRSFDRQGCRQAVVCGIFRSDCVDFPEGVKCYPVFFTHRGEEPADGDLPFPVVGMSDIMPYESTLYRDMTPEMIDLFEEAFVKAVSKAVEELDPDIIICHHLFLLTAIVRKHFPGRVIAGLSHGSDLRQFISCSHLQEMLIPGIAGLDKIFALNGEQQKRISKLFGVSADRITIIGSGYNDRLFNAEARHPRVDIEQLASPMTMPVIICYAGKMSLAKGIPEFLHVLKRLTEDPEVPEIEVSLAGGCHEPAVMEELEKRPENVHWLGQIAQDRLADIFRCSDIFVLPSYYEGLPLVLIEAMASGMVPVSTDLPGVQPWVNENVPDNNIVFVPMPEMASIDEPTEKGKAEFEEDLYNALKALVLKIKSGELPSHLPDTSGITWDGVASRILSKI